MMRPADSNAALQEARAFDCEDGCALDQHSTRQATGPSLTARSAQCALIVASSAAGLIVCAIVGPMTKLATSFVMAHPGKFVAAPVPAARAEYFGGRVPSVTPPTILTRHGAAFQDPRDFVRIASAVKHTPLKPIDDWMDENLQRDAEDSVAWAGTHGGGLLPVQPASNIKLQVKSGQLPAGLAGNYLRVGPNPAFWPPKKRTGIFDGDGMVHSVRILNGSAVYHCQYMKTPRFKFEEAYGQEFFSRMGSMQSISALATNSIAVQKVLAASLEFWEAGGMANTAITFTPDGKLWALHELAPPFRFRLGGSGEPQSVGYDTFLGRHARPMSAHPKIDHRTKEILFHGRDLMRSFFVARAKGDRVTDLVDITGRMPMMPAGFHHDIAVTENYLVVIDGSMRMNPACFVDPHQKLFKIDPRAPLRFGLLPRNGAAGMRAEDIIWIKAPAVAEIVHTLHAYDDERGRVVLWAPMAFPTDQADRGGVLGGVKLNSMRRIVIDARRRSATVEVVSPGDQYYTEFPRIRDDRVGGRVRYGYSAIQGPGGDFDFMGILKWDFQKRRLSNSIHFPVGVTGGEPVFMPKDGSSADADGDEGYIGMFLWKPGLRESTFAIYDAQSFSSTPIAELLVPRRVPIGFHGAWLTEEQFRQQLAT